jgi:hypothetical protein
MNQAEKLLSALENATKDYIKGERDDVRAFLLGVSEEVAQIATVPDLSKRQEMLEEVKARFLVMKEKHRIRAVRKGWQTFDLVVRVLVEAL